MHVDNKTCFLSCVFENTGSVSERPTDNISIEMFKKMYVPKHKQFNSNSSPKAVLLNIMIEFAWVLFNTVSHMRLFSLFSWCFCCCEKRWVLQFSQFSFHPTYNVLSIITEMYLQGSRRRLIVPFVYVRKCNSCLNVLIHFAPLTATSAFKLVHGGQSGPFQILYSRFYDPLPAI